MKRLPIGLSTFRTIREIDCLYIDKTEYAYNLIQNGWRYFLARPRRFGKSLFVSTLQEILSGNKELFDDLWIGSSDYQWQPHGIVMLDFSALGIDSVDAFKKNVCTVLKEQAEDYELTIKIDPISPEMALRTLVKALRKKFGRVAVLIDEYDSPILHVLNDSEKALPIRDAMSLFFKTIKSLDSDINFVFLTGVSTFSKAGVFSGLNNLSTITLNDNFGALCGCTDEEVDTYFKEYIQTWANKENCSYQKLRQEIKTWYNGYRFGDAVSSVYNPFSLLNALYELHIDNFWIQSGTPTFLIKEITKEYRNKELRVFNPENISLKKEDLGVIDIGALPLPTLLFQTGYLTIDRYDRDNEVYTLKLPNLEVKTAYQKMLLTIVAHIDSAKAFELLQKLKQGLIENDLPAAITVLKILFAHVTYYQHESPDFAKASTGTQESFYHAILQTIFDLAGIKTQSEYATSHGRIDLVLEFPNKFYIIEVKLNQTAESALEQIEKRRYQESFIGSGKSIELVGLAFKREPHNFEITYASKLLH